MNSRYDVRCIADGFSFLEGPRWHRGCLYVSDFYTHRVLSFDGAGSMKTICTVPNQPSGLGFMPDGDLVVVSMIDRKLMRLHGGNLIEQANLRPYAPCHCNDLLVDRQGRSYVGNFGWELTADSTIKSTALIIVHPDGSIGIAAEDLVFPNGMALAPTGKTLFVAETFAARISAFDVAEDGSIGMRRTWAAFSKQAFGSVSDAVGSGVPLPDGIALDAEGALWIGDAAGRGALRVVEGGEIIERVDTGERTAFAVALGGGDRRTLYLCTAPPMPSEKLNLPDQSALLSCQVRVPGAGIP